MALPTSGTYNFLSITAELIIRDAFENIGITSAFRDFEKMNAATRALNLLNLEWMSKSYNLWTVESGFVPLVQGQYTYTLPSYVENIVQVNTRTFTRQLDPNGSPASFNLNFNNVGVAQSNTGTTYDNAGGGIPHNAFITNPGACTQNVADGNISFDYGANFTKKLTSVGIQSNTDTFYSLVLESSNDSVSWANVITIIPQPFVIGFNEIFDISPIVSVSARYYRIREIGGEVLNIQKLFFNTGYAPYAFDGLATTSCTQQSTNGGISYLYSAVPVNNSTANTMVGITANTTQTYTINVRASVLNDGNYITLLSIPSQVYPAGIPQWFDLSTSVSALYYDIIEVTPLNQNPAALDVQELYFTNNTTDITVSNISLYEYMTFPNKYYQSRPTCFYLDRQFQQPNLILWPVPNNSYPLLQFTYKKMIQDVSSLSQTIEIPARFYPTMIWGLSWRLAIKYRPEMADRFKAEYEESFKIATIEDSENVPFEIAVDWTYT